MRTKATDGTTVGRVLWVVQGLLAALFLFAGVMKLVLPAEALTAQSPFSAEFLRFIGVCETLGAIGLLLPGLLRIKPELTAIAAGGLVIIMVGATVFTLTTPAAATAAIPFIVGVLAAFVAYGRWRVAPYRGTFQARALHTAA
jgi:hypothetical protein